MPTITCPYCRKAGQLPDGFTGSTVKCPTCYGKFPVPRQETMPVFTPTGPPPLTATLCPFCAEPIAAQAKKCKHCGEMLDPILRSQEEMRRQHLAPGHGPVQQVTFANSQPAALPYRVNHGVHLLLTIFTCGLWLPVWIIDILLHWGSH